MTAASMIAWGVETLIASTLLMIVVLAVRSRVRRAFGAGVAYALWLLPLARMVMPPLPGGWSLLRPVTRWGSGALDHGFVMGLVNPHSLPASVASHVVAKVTVASPVAGTRAVEIAVLPPSAFVGGPSPLLLVGFAWAMGAAAFLAFHLLRHWRFCARLRRTALRRSLISGQRIVLIESLTAVGPLAFGIWKKHVVLPRDFDARYDADERTLAVAHELMHHARGDLIANWIALVVLAVHWFNPVAWRAFRAFRADQELACDAQVLAGRSVGLREAYGRAILKSAHGGAVSAACHLHTINELKGRLRMLSQKAKSRRLVAAGAATVALVTLAGVGLTASGSDAATGGDRGRLTWPGRHAAHVVPPPAAPKVPAVPGKPAVPAAPPAPTVPAAAEPDDVTAPQAPEPPAPPAPVFGGVVARDMVADVPEVSEGNCPPAADEKTNVVITDNSGGRNRIIICNDRIEKLAAAADGQVDETAIERNAYQTTLSSLRAARQKVLARGGDEAGKAEALKGIDEAIADVEQDLASLK